jgi:octaprenyl-diphosphate synthase
VGDISSLANVRQRDSPRESPSPLETVVKQRVALAIGHELKAVEAALAEQLDSSVSLIREMSKLGAGAGGKRLRPVLLLLAARVAGYRGPRAVRMSCVVELLHTATLVHDDVVDKALLRRGRPSINARWGPDAAVLFGDHLYAKSLALMLEDGDRDVLETLARATVSMTEAEVLQLQLKRSMTTCETDYLQIVTQKTASFMSACCRIGALLGNCESDRLKCITRYGLDLGIAFQICDDSLDFVADEIRLGKSMGADLREGRWTLPLIAMLKRAACSERERVLSLLKVGHLGGGELEEIRCLVVRHGGVDYALERARDYARAAKESLRRFADSEDKETLKLIADFAVERDH